MKPRPGRQGNGRKILGWLVGMLNRLQPRSLRRLFDCTLVGSIEETAPPWRFGLFVIMYGCDYGALRPEEAAAIAELIPGKHLDTILRIIFPCARRSRPHRPQSMADSAEDTHGASMRLDYPKGGTGP
jgi:hypothetical protein